MYHLFLLYDQRSFLALSSFETSVNILDCFTLTLKALRENQYTAVGVINTHLHSGSIEINLRKDWCINRVRSTSLLKIILNSRRMSQYVATCIRLSENRNAVPKTLKNVLTRLYKTPNAVFKLSTVKLRNSGLWKVCFMSHGLRPLYWTYVCI